MSDLNLEARAAERGGTLHLEILERLRNYLVESDIADGGRIPERELCMLFGVSRTPMREALKVLASEGLVELLPNRGARMKALSVHEIKELFDLMGGLEALAGRLACEKISDEEFGEIEALHHEMYARYLRKDRSGYFFCNQKIHESIFLNARNDALSTMARTLQARLRRVRYAANQDEDGERWRTAVHEHELILDALRRRDANGIAALLFAHLRQTQEAVLRGIRTDV